MTWNDFVEWQRWDEYPESKDNPPMTVDFSFILDSKTYYITAVDHKYVIMDQTWKIILSNTNFLFLLTTPFYKDESFKDIIEKLKIT